ncbi:MAG: V-type ATPase 116kDa subunit family protein [Candidatus Sedimenticola sp. (ex Thyasira tokunagai)]
MFKPLLMKHVMLQVLTEDLPLVSLTLAEKGVFSPDYRICYAESFPDIPGTHYREIYHQACSRLQKIEGQISLSEKTDISHLHVVSEDQLTKTNDWLGEVWKRCSAYEENFRRLGDDERMVNQLSLALDNFVALNIDLSLLQGEKLFLDIHVGMLPRENVAQLKEAIGLADYLLFTYMEQEGNAHIIALGLKGERVQEMNSVLDTAGFRPLPIPPELRNEPDKVRADLEDRRKKITEEWRRETEDMISCGNELRQMLEEAKQTLVMSEPFVDMENAARSSGHLSIISGWIPAREIAPIEATLKKILENPFQLNARDPSREEYHLVPSFMPKSRLMSPFATLVKQYGIPRYGEIDPTIIFALTFVAMFGMMFGDIGHGLVITFAAWAARKKLKKFTLFAVAAGISASLFGLLYGSIFGYEHLFHAVWIPPLSDPIYMLSMALGWGVGFLVIITLLSIHNRLVSGDLNSAIFETNGVVSIILYLSILSGTFNLYKNGDFGILPAFLSILSLLTLLAYKLIETKASPGERMMVATIETFETLTGYISNTLSFLRIAAFSLNHVALAVAVFTLADMTEGTGHWLMVIGGNIFILVLEGAIVTIQVLRLEYYEGFSRFYAGDGREFKPLILNSGGTK